MNQDWLRADNARGVYDIQSMLPEVTFLSSWQLAFPQPVGTVLKEAALGVSKRAARHSGSLTPCPDPLASLLGPFSSSRAVPQPCGCSCQADGDAWCRSGSLLAAPEAQPPQMP